MSTSSRSTPGAPHLCCRLSFRELCLPCSSQGLTHVHSVLETDYASGTSHKYCVAAMGTPICRYQGQSRKGGAERLLPLSQFYRPSLRISLRTPRNARNASSELEAGFQPRWSQFSEVSTPAAISCSVSKYYPNVQD